MASGGDWPHGRKATLGGRLGPGEQPAILAEPATHGCSPRCFVIRRGLRLCPEGKEHREGFLIDEHSALSQRSDGKGGRGRVSQHGLSP